MKKISCLAIRKTSVFNAKLQNKVKLIILILLFLTSAISLNAQNTYCNPGSALWNESVYLTSFRFGNINLINIPHTPGYGNYYDYTNIIDSLKQGFTYNMQCHVPVDSLNTSYIKIWIDFNKDTVFSNNELIYLSSSPAKILSDSITMPHVDSTGPFRMRVRLFDFYNTFDACQSNGYGCTYDFTARLFPSPGCRSIPNPGNTLSTTNTVCTGTFFTLSLQNSFNRIDSVGFQWQSSFSPEWQLSDPNQWNNISGANAKTLTIYQSQSTYYRCAVFCLRDPGGVDFSNPFLVYNNSLFECNCTPPPSTYLCSTFISNVTTSGGISDFNNNSGCSATSYEDFRNTVVASNMQLSTTTLTFASDTYAFDYSVWIDFNDNGIYNNNEKVVSLNNPDGLLSVSCNFIIPETAAPGTHNMRVRGDFDSTPSDPCTGLMYGETEDYSFTVIAKPPCNATPNPGNTIATATSFCPGNDPITLSLQNSVIDIGITYQWQWSANDTIWGDIAGANNETTLISQSATTYYRCKVTCVSGPSVAYSNPIQILINPPSACLCIPSASISACSFMWIDNVITHGGVSDFSHSSACSATSYSNFSTSCNASNVPGGTTTLTLSSANYPLCFSVWIDFNDDGNLTPEEQVIMNANYDYQSVDESFTVPTDAVPGTHIMRVRGEYYSTIADACTQLFYGETEDYLFTVVGPCSGTPNPGNTLSNKSSVCAGASFTLSLQNPVLASGITYVWQSSSDSLAWNDIPNALSSSLITTQEAPTYYRCVVSCNAGPATSISNPVQVIMSTVDCYCIPAVSNMAWQGCMDVTLNNVTTSGGLTNFSNPSSCEPASYSNYSATLSASNYVNATTKMTFSSDYNPCNYSVWIDFNANSIFEPTEQVIFYTNMNDLTTVADSFPVPSNALPGTYRMRVRADKFWFGMITDPCYTLMFGETEDYSFTVVNNNTELPATPTIGTLIQPNCDVPVGSIELSNLPGNGDWTITRLPDNTPYPGTGTSITLSDIPSGTYSFTVTNAANATSLASAEVVINGIKCVSLHLYLEALYNAAASKMNEALDLDAVNGGNIPKFGTGIADAIEVELHDAGNYSIILYNTGNLNLNTDGYTTFSLPTSFTDSYYIAIRNRNGIETVSTSAVSFAASSISYDFTNAASQAYGNNLKEISASNFAVYGGDVSQDGIVDGSDMAAIDNASTAVMKGYYPEDVNGDGIVDGSDMALIDNNSTAVIQKKTP